MEFKLLNRRNILIGLMYFALASLIQPIRGLATLIDGKKANPLIEKLSNFYIHKLSARVIGREYLRQIPDEANLERLVELLCSEKLLSKEKMLHLDLTSLRKLLQSQQQRDFENGQIVRSIHRKGPLRSPRWAAGLTEGPKDTIEFRRRGRHLPQEAQGDRREGLREQRTTPAVAPDPLHAGYRSIVTSVKS